ASGDVPRALAALGRMVDALESYLREAPSSGASPPVLESIADTALGSDPDPVPEADTAATAQPGEEPGPGADARVGRAHRAGRGGRSILDRAETHGQREGDRRFDPPEARGQGPPGPVAGHRADLERLGPSPVRGPAHPARRPGRRRRRD